MLTGVTKIVTVLCLLRYRMTDDSAHLSYRFEYFVELKLKFKDKFCPQLNMPLSRVVSEAFIYCCEYGTIQT